MSRRKGDSPNERLRRKGNHSAGKRRSAPKEAAKNQKLRRQTARRQAEEVRVFGALNLVRRGTAKSPTEAAQAKRTTLPTIRKVAPDALVQDHPGARIRVKATDRYSARVQILTTEGSTVTVTARGSRQRELAGRHRATALRVLQGKEPPSSLEQYRGKKVGRRELISDYSLLSSLADAGVLGQLDTLYVSPDASV
jgi:hypothetical protein